MTNAKLFQLTDSNFTLPLYVDSNRQVACTPAQDIPMLSWPNGQWCFPANLYMVELYRRGLSRKNSGGTLASYAANISHLLRFCYQKKLNLIDLTDNEFSRFIEQLQKERSQLAPERKRRNANTVIGIGRICLDFLTAVGRIYQDDMFVGPNGRICAEQREFELSKGPRDSGFRLIRNSWHHRSFPTPDPVNRRLPISSTSIRKLQEAVLPSSTSVYLRKRRYVMLKLLEITGGRRSEVAALTVDSVLKASNMAGEAQLKLITAKRRGGEDDVRYVPIARHDVAFLIEFIIKNRRHVVRSTCGLQADDGYLLVNKKTGRKLRPNTITQEIALLAKAAGITEKCCPHMFRHRFITKLFVALIEQHKFENQDDFRRALLETEAIKRKVQELTGHKTPSSLETYINFAFEEVANFKKTYSIVTARGVIDSFRSNLEQLKLESANNASSTETNQSLMKLLEALETDLQRIQGSSS